VIKKKKNHQASPLGLSRTCIERDKEEEEERTTRLHRDLYRAGYPYLKTQGW
jgi:hypothetical protein